MHSEPEDDGARHCPEDDLDAAASRVSCHPRVVRDTDLDHRGALSPQFGLGLGVEQGAFRREFQ